MGELRFRVQGVRPGSAARSAETSSRETPAPQLPVARAGSSARLAEEAKRREGSLAAPMATISLRGKGGEVTRTPQATSVSSRTAPVACASEAISSAATPFPHTSPMGATQGADASHPAAPPESFIGRFTSVFRRFFQPGNAQ